jgi:cystathionine beta-lyase/cystathionine gamma-synthase
MLSFEPDGGAAAAVGPRFGRLTSPPCAPSLRGPGTLIARPAAISHAGWRPTSGAGRASPIGLIRLSVGLESTQDLIDDLAAGLAAALG